MPENEFEKQVQQKMDELQFVPSAVVWEEVEKQIPRRKKRRILLIWLPFLLLLLGGAAWIYHSEFGAGSNKKNTAGEQKPSAVVTNSHRTDIIPNSLLVKKETKKIQIDTATALRENTPAENHSAVVVNKKIQKGIISNNSDQKDDGLEERGSINEIVANNKTGHKKNTAGIKMNSNGAGYISNADRPLKKAHKKAFGNSIQEKSIAGEEVMVVNNGELKKQDNKADEVVLQNGKDVDASIAKDSVAASVNLAVTKTDKIDSVKNTGKTDSTKIITKNKPAGKKKKLEWGFNMDVGVSNIAQRLTGLLSETPSSGTAYFSAPQTNNSTATGSGFNLSGVKPGLAFSTGIFISKPFGKHLHISAGLQYSYSSTHIGVGQKIDSNKAAVQYRTGNSGHYTNQFHFIEVPVMVEKQLGRLPRFSINGGIAFSILAGSNALQYNAQKNIYDIDNSRINKTQWSLLAGFHYRLLQKKLKLEIGPQLSYDFSNIFKKELYGSRHLFFAGISTKIFFGKN